MQESDTEVEDSDDDDDDSVADEFEEAERACGMFSCIFRVLELTPGQQKELFKAAAKGLFHSENLGYLDVSQHAHAQRLLLNVFVALDKRPLNFQT